MSDTTQLAAQGFDATALHAAYARGLSPADVVSEALRRLRAADDPAIFLHLADEQSLRAEALALGTFDPSRPLWGLPCAVKDNIDVAGWPTTAACPAYAYVPKADAAVVAALRAAGAIVIGKTNLDQFATGLVGVRSPYGAPRNALDPAIVPGGSSSGSAVAVARGIVTFALGTDTAGSGRVPAALNGIVGLKPTLGAISGRGVVPACQTLDTVSVFALTVADAAEVFRAAAVYDHADPWAWPCPVPPLGAMPAGLHVAVPDAASLRFFGDAAQAESFAAAVATLRGLGARIEEVDFTPFYDVAALLYEGAWVAERLTVVEELLARDPDALHPVTRQIIGGARRLSAADAFRGMYRLAALKLRTAPVLARADLLCVPTMPTFVTVAETEADPIGPNSRLGTYTNFANLLDLCGIAVPVAPRRDGRPGGVTLLAASGRDMLAATVGQALQQAAGAEMGATGHRPPPAPAADPAPMPDELAVCVVGAHMAGLPLNAELTSRGGRFLRAAVLGPDYRMFALAGAGPRRPGVLRSPGAGSAIAAEVWALPLAEVGGFLRGIPAPLGLGTVTLADGATVCGFLCEAAATAGAEEITGFGGWRGWLAARG